MIEHKNILDIISLYRKKFTKEEVLESVCQALHITRDKMLLRGKPQWLTEARQIYFFFCNETCDETLIAYSLEVNCISHTSVLHGWQNITDKLEIGDDIITEKVTLVYKNLLGQKIYK